MSDLREVVEGLLAGKVYTDGDLKWRMKNNVVQYQKSLSEGWFRSGLGLNEIIRRGFVEYKVPLSHTEALDLMMMERFVLENDDGYRLSYRGDALSRITLDYFVESNWYKAE